MMLIYIVKYVKHSQGVRTDLKKAFNKHALPLANNQN